MNLEEYRSLCATFSDYRIDPSAPGFYDDRRFIRAEEVDRAFIQTYARFVESQPYDDVYLERCRTEIPAIATLIWQELVRDGRLGACIDVGMVLSRILESEGIWNYMVKGSLTISFPASAQVPRRFFYSWDVVPAGRAFAAAHAWLIAPPFGIVDISVKQQPYPNNVGRELLPDVVLVENPTVCPPDPKDLFSPTFLAARRVSEGNAISVVEPRLERFLEQFPPVAASIEDVELKYTRIAISAPDAPFADMTGIRFNQRTGLEIYETIIKPALAQIRA